MRILAFNTCTPYCSVALENNGKIDFRIANYKAQQAEKLLPFSEDLLAASKLSYSDLDYLAINIGPGSFTGIRIGIAAAQGILLAIESINQAPVTAFEINSAKAFKHAKTANYSLVVINALRGGVYTCLLDKSLNQITPPELINIEDFEKYLHTLTQTKCPAEELLLTGSGCKLEEIKTNKLASKCMNPEDYRLADSSGEIDARDVLEATKIKLSNSSDFGDLSPLYIRKPDTGEIK